MKLQYAMGPTSTLQLSYSDEVRFVAIAVTGSITLTQTIGVGHLKSTHAVFSIVELLENVLRFLSPAEIVRAQMVCKLFRTTVSGSDICGDAACLYRAPYREGIWAHHILQEQNKDRRRDDETWWLSLIHI